MQAELVIQMLSPDYYVNNHRPYNFVRKKNKTIVKTYPRRTGWHRWDSRFWRDSRRRSPSCCQSCSTWGRIVADESPWCHPLGQHRDPRHPCHCHPPVRSSLLDRTRDQLLLQLNKKKIHFPLTLLIRLTSSKIYASKQSQTNAHDRISSRLSACSSFEFVIYITVGIV